MWDKGLDEVLYSTTTPRTATTYVYCCTLEKLIIAMVTVVGTYKAVRFILVNEGWGEGLTQ